MKSVLAIALAALVGASCHAQSDEQAAADAGDSTASPMVQWPIQGGVSSFVTQSAARSDEPFPCGSGVNAQHILQGEHGDNHDYEHSLDIVTRNRDSEAAPLTYEGRGTDIVAVADGVVVASSALESECERSLGAGNYVIVEHPHLRLDGRPILSAYMHLNSHAEAERSQECSLNPNPIVDDAFASPEVGAIVRAGQKIGELGNTGNSTGAHLHFQFATDCLLAPANDVACTAISILDIAPQGFSNIRVAHDASCPDVLATGGPLAPAFSSSYLVDGSYVTSAALAPAIHLAAR